MEKNRFKTKFTVRNSIIILLSILGLIVCITVLFPQIRRMIMDLLLQITHREPPAPEYWIRVFLSYAMGGICFILFFDFCTLTDSGKLLVQKVKGEIKHCMSEINFRSFIKPVLLLSGIYLLGSFTILRADFYYYFDDLVRSMSGRRLWYPGSRYISDFLSIFIHADTKITDISPIPQLISIIILSVSSVLLVYVLGNKRITNIRLLASIPLGLSPYFLANIAFKYDAPYMALSILASIVPFLFIDRKKAFIFCSIISLLIMCMTYQASSGIYPLIAVILCFIDWNNKKKTYKEIIYFLATAFFTFCFALLIFRLFFMLQIEGHQNSMHPVNQIVTGTLYNIKEYAIQINNDFGIIWKAGIILVITFFIIKSTVQSKQKKAVSFIVSIFFIGILFTLSYGVYPLISNVMFNAYYLYGFGVFLAIICIYIVSDYKKAAIIAVLALNWCFFVFAISFGNALADQNRYANFRVGILLQDLSTLYPDKKKEELFFQINNSIEFTPVVNNIAKHNPVIKRLVPVHVEENLFSYIYIHNFYNFGKFNSVVFSFHKEYKDYKKLNLPVVLDSYYHTIQSDGNHTLVVLKH